MEYLRRPSLRFWRRNQTGNIGENKKLKKKMETQFNIGKRIRVAELSENQSNGGGGVKPTTAR